MSVHDQILREQRGYDPLPLTPGITPEQLSRTGKYSSKSNPCPVCQKTHGCKISDNLVMCLRGDKDWSIPGWRYIKPLDRGMGGLFGRDTGNRNNEYRPQIEKTAKTSNIQPLTDEELDYNARLIFKQLGLTEKHREQLKDKGLNDDQINKIEFRSVTKFQEFNLVKIDPNFPGINTKGTLNNGGAGILIPCRNNKGQITGFQIARDDRNPKYQWLLGCSERRVSGERPLQFLKLNDSRILNISEATLKPLIAAYKHNINVLGEGGCQWASSPKELKAVVDSGLFDVYILNPDAGSKLNNHVLGGYRALFLFLKNLGISLLVRDWGQGKQSKSEGLDIDEIDTETFNNASVISYQEWDTDLVVKDELITEDEWVKQFQLPKLNEGLANILKRFTRFSKKQVAQAEAATPGQPTTINQNCSAIVPYVPQKLSSIKYIPGQLPTAEEWAEMGYPKIIFEPGQRLQLLAEIHAQDLTKYTLDTTPTGHGKSYDAGLIDLQTFGIDPNDSDNKSRIFYLSVDHRNPTNKTVEANYEDLEARHPGLIFDHTRTTAMGKPYQVRANKNQSPDIPSNCPENATFLLVGELGLTAFGGKDSPICQSCPLLMNGCQFLDNRRNTLKNERLIRADINSMGTPASDDILILDDLAIGNTHQISIKIDEILKTVGKLQLHDDRIFKAIRPILVAVYKGVQVIKSDTHKYGIPHSKVMELLPTIDELNQLIWDLYSDDWLKAKDVWGVPIWHYEMVNGVPEATKVIGEDWVAPSLQDLKIECYKIFENYAKFINGTQSPEEKQQVIEDNVIPSWLPSLIDCLCGNKRINLMIDNGKLSITKLSKRHRNIVKGAGFTISLDATQSKADYALSLGVRPNEILEISEIKRETPNLKIHFINGMGKGSAQRRDTKTQRYVAATEGIAALHQGQSIGLIDHKSAMDGYKDLAQSPKLGYWHRDTRGSNQFLHSQVLISVGLPIPNLSQMAAEYQSLTGYSPVPDRLTGKYGQWVARKIQAELIQCTGRVRAHLRPGEQLHVYLVADMDDATASAVRLAYPTATFTNEDIYDIEPTAASKGKQTERGIIQALWDSIQAGGDATIDQIASAIGKAKSTVTFTLKQRLGMGFRVLKKSLVLLKEAITSKTKLSELPDDVISLAREYLVLEDLVQWFEDGHITAVDVVTDFIENAEAVGEQEFKRVLAATSISTLCKLLGIVLRFVPKRILESLLMDFSKCFTIREVATG